MTAKKPKSTRPRWNDAQWSEFADKYDELKDEGARAIAEAIGITPREVLTRASALRRKGVDMPSLARGGSIPVSLLQEKFGKIAVEKPKARKKKAE